METLGQIASGSHLHPGAKAVPQPSLYRFHQERADLPRVLTESYRPTGGTRSSQRQQDQLTPEITRWQKASTRTLPTETKVTWHHHNPVLPQQQFLGTPNTGKARFEFKITLMMLIEDFKKDINNSLKELQENTGKQIETIKEETQKSLKEL